MFLFQIVARGDGDVIHHRARHLMERHTNNLKFYIFKYREKPVKPGNTIKIQWP